MTDYLSQDMEMCPWPKKHFLQWNLKQMEEKKEVWEGVGVCVQESSLCLS